MDFHRKCKKLGVRIALPPQEAEEEMASLVENPLEEATPANSEGALLKEIDFELLRDEMDCIKERTNQVKLILKADKLDKCPYEECVDFEVELMCSKNKDICALQRTHYKLVCQVNELVESCKSTKSYLKDLHALDCHEGKVIAKQKKQVGELLSWQMHWNREFGHCKQRFDFLKKDRCDWSDMKEMLDTHNQAYNATCQKMLKREILNKEKTGFVKELTDLNDIFHKIRNEEEEAFRQIEKLARTYFNAPNCN